MGEYEGDVGVKLGLLGELALKPGLARTPIAGDAGEYAGDCGEKAGELGLVPLNGLEGT